MGKCLNCEYWGGNMRAYNGCDFESFRQATGKCHCSGVNNPHYFNQDHLTADDGCNFWSRHHAFMSEEERKAREAAERAAEEKRKAKEAEEKAATEKKAREAKEAAERAAEEKRETAEKVRTAAEQGDVEAQHELGRLYFTGQGVPKDYAKAAEWFGKAAEQGHAEAKEWIAKTEAAIEEEKVQIAQRRKKREEETAKEKMREKLAILGLVLQIVVAVATVVLFFVFRDFFRSLPLLLKAALPVGAPVLAIGIISLAFRKKEFSLVGMVLIVLIDIVIALGIAKGFWGGIGFLIICTISALPGFIMWYVNEVG